MPRRVTGIERTCFFCVSYFLVFCFVDFFVFSYRSNTNLVFFFSLFGSFWCRSFVLFLEHDQLSKRSCLITPSHYIYNIYILFIRNIIYIYIYNMFFLY